jgi:hypothetical protein
MKKSKLVRILGLAVVVLAMIFTSPTISLSDPGADYSPQGSGNVVIIIQSADPETIFHAVQFSERAIANQWMDNVKIVLWGPAEKTIAGLTPDHEIMVLIKKIQAMGGKSARIWCCKACSDRYGISDKMNKLGFEVFHVGNATSYLIKLGYRIWNW